jgi:serine/threonine protein phosphatase 1
MTSTGQKIFAIGDIHGCHDNLVALMGRLPIDKSTDKLVFLGDFINRGPDTKKVVETLLEVRASYAHVVFLMGNHEQALLEYSATGDLELLPALRAMGVEATLASYGASARGLYGLSCMPQEHRDFLNSLEFFHVVGNYLFTHADFDEQKLALAGARPDALAAQRFAEAGLLASRRLGQEIIADTGYTIVFGHLPFEAPLVMTDRIGIDTGAVYGGVLTAVELPTLHFYHA